MNEQATTTAIFAACLLSAGCATIESAGNVRPHSPRFYAGTRLDLAAIDYDRDSLDHFSSYNMLPPAHPGIDLPLSLVADTALLPFVLLYTITEPVQGAR